MKLPSYKSVLKMGKEKINQRLAPVKNSRAKKQAELEMAKIEEEIATKEADLHEECCNEEVNFSKIIDMQDSLALAERRKKQYQKILEEMFPDDE
jgi:hypothetical protein